jgi:hypothetical protein
MIKIQPMKDLIAEMRAVSRGEVQPPADAASPSGESVQIMPRREARQTIEQEAESVKS